MFSSFILITTPHIYYDIVRSLKINVHKLDDSERVDYQSTVSFELAPCNWMSHGTKSKIFESKRMCQTPKQNTINLKSVIFLCLHFPVESCHILLLSNILDFVPSDLQLQRANWSLVLG